MPASVLQPRAAACSDRQRASAPSGSRRSGRTRAATITSPHCVRRLAECSKVECGMWKFEGGGLHSGRPPPLRSGELRCNVGSAGRPAAAAGAETGTGHLSTSVLATETKRTRVESKSMRSLRQSMLQRGGGTVGGGGRNVGGHPYDATQLAGGVAAYARGPRARPGRDPPRFQLSRRASKQHLVSAFTHRHVAAEMMRFSSTFRLERVDGGGTTMVQFMSGGEFVRRKGTQANA